jgi:hypothetical protein
MKLFGLGSGCVLALGVVVACGGDDTGGSTTAGGTGGSTSSSSASGGGQGGAATSTSTASSTSTTQSSTGTGGDPATDCFGNVTWPAPATPTITAHFTAFEFFTAMGLQQFSVRACPRGDSVCAVPVAEATTSNGSLDLDVPTGTEGFDGYFEVTGPQLATTLWHLSRPIAANEDVASNVFAQQSLDLMVQAIGGAGDPARGHIGVSTRNCADAQMGGAVIAVDPVDAGTTIRYFSGALTPDPALTSTSGNGFAGLVNVVTGDAVTLTGTVEASSELFASVELVVRPAAISVLILRPTPLP